MTFLCISELLYFNVNYRRKNKILLEMFLGREIFKCDIRSYIFISPDKKRKLLKTILESTDITIIDGCNKQKEREMIGVLYNCL